MIWWMTLVIVLVAGASWHVGYRVGYNHGYQWGAFNEPWEHRGRKWSGER